jgi:hypothetical protein
MANYEWVASPIFRIIPAFYIAMFGILIIRYARKSRNDPEKGDRFYWNEMLLGITTLILAAMFPWLFLHASRNIYIVGQIYFHIWDSLTVHFFAWAIYLWRAKVNNIRKNRFEPYEQWKARIKKMHETQPQWKLDVRRKLMHLLPPSVIIGGYYAAIAVEPIVGQYMQAWDYYSISILIWANLALHFTFIFFIADLLRLTHFEKLGHFAKRWYEKQITPKELNSFTSTNPMTISMIPFIFAPLPIFFSVVLIGTIADAAASTVGKYLGKIRSTKTQKTLEGYIAGVLATIGCVHLGFWIVPLPNVGIELIWAMALASGFCFLMVDLFAKRISDNFLNSLTTGAVMVLLYVIFAL